jgi:hypothetical protein
MEYRLGAEDIRGQSPSSEDPGQWNTTMFGEDDPLWGGYAAWNDTLQCTSIVVVGFHFGSGQNLSDGLVTAVTGDQPCELLEHARHTRIHCCTRHASTSVVLYVGGQSSTPAVFDPSLLVLKPVITVRSGVWLWGGDGVGLGGGGWTGVGVGVREDGNLL